MSGSIESAATKNRKQKRLMIQQKKKICSHCGNLEYIWKNVGRNKYSLRCWNIIKEPTEVKPRMSIAPVSDKKKKEDSIYSQLRARFFSDEENKVCKARLPGCTYVATEVHHKRGRGKWYLIVLYWIGLCRHCHDYITEHSDIAIEMGFSDSRLNKDAA